MFPAEIWLKVCIDFLFTVRYIDFSEAKWTELTDKHNLGSIWDILSTLRCTLERKYWLLFLQSVAFTSIAVHKITALFIWQHKDAPVRIKPLKRAASAHCTGRAFVELETKVVRMYIHRKTAAQKSSLRSSCSAQATMMTLLEIQRVDSVKHWFSRVDVRVFTISFLPSPHIHLLYRRRRLSPPLPQPITLYVLRISHSPEAAQAPPLATAARLVALSQVIWGKWATQRRRREAVL